MTGQAGEGAAQVAGKDEAVVCSTVVGRSLYLRHDPCDGFVVVVSVRCAAV